MDGRPLQTTLPMPTPGSANGPLPLLLVDGHNLLWGATFGFPAPIYSRDRSRLLTGLFAFVALLRVAIRDDVPGGAPEVVVVFDGEHGAATRQQAHNGYKASRPLNDEALAPLQFLPDVKRALDNCGIAWTELEYAEADDVIATLVHATNEPRRVIIMSRDKDYYQLVTDRVEILNTRFRASRKLVTPAEVYARHQVTPVQWADFRALAGDPADDIPGVRGIGAKTAAALLAGGLTLDDLPASGRLAAGRGRPVRTRYQVARHDPPQRGPGSATAAHRRSQPAAASACRCCRGTRPVVTPADSVLTVMAHPDDAELWSGGALVLHAGAGAQITIVVLRADEVRDREAAAGAEALGGLLRLLDELTVSALRDLLTEL